MNARTNTSNFLKCKPTRKKKFFRHSSTFYRQLQRLKSAECNSVVDIINNSSVVDIINNSSVVDIINNSSHKVSISSNIIQHQSAEQEVQTYDEHGSFDIVHQALDVQSTSKEFSLAEQLKEWSLLHNIAHSSVDALLHILKSHNLSYLPTDSRTLLRTPRTVKIANIGNGQVWYNGLENCLLNVFRRLTESVSVSLIINIDGLPPFKGSPLEFWPILCKIEGKSHIKPFVVSIFCGTTKPPLKEFLTPFVEELNSLLVHGTKSAGHKIEIRMRYFVCDTPARNFIKGTVGFNASHGCIKCTVVGEFDKKGRHMSFPHTDCPLRTDHSFRQKFDEDHHKEDTPLLNVQPPFDIIKDIIVADSLHLFDLGIMRKLLLGWLNGGYNFRTKLPSKEIEAISCMLEECNQQKPAEIHRAIRSLKSLKFWKGTEFRTFLLYLGPVVLKPFLPHNVYHNFLTLFSAVTLVSCKTYSKFIPVAKQLFEDFIEQYIDIYGIDAVSSNVHNLCHVTDDVTRFGNLSEISAYPFENLLGHLKSLMRNGNKPLAQIAKRVLELTEVDNVQQSNKISYPYVKHENASEAHQLPFCQKVFKNVYISESFMLSNDIRNKWFLTKENEIISMLNATFHHDKINIYGSRLRKLSNFFDLPIKSSYLNIYCSNGKQNEPDLYELSEIKCKLMCLKHKDEFVFMPLLHTLDDN